MRIATRLAQAGTRRDPRTGSVSAPIYQTATFTHPALGQSTGFDYSRFQNPTRFALEEALNDLEGGRGAFAFASGMAALHAACHVFKRGDHVIISEDLYGGTYRLVENVLREQGLLASYVDTADPAAVAAALTPATRGLLVESPTNPLCRIADLAALGRLAKERRLTLIVDNTFLTPYLQQPFQFGAHMVVHSASKFLAGHNDVIAGAVVCRTPALAEEVGYLQGTCGALLGPQDCWLVLRGLKTLALRLDRSQQNALALARWLAAHPQVSHVFYPGLPDHPGHLLNQQQARGPGAMLSFRLADQALVEQVLNRVQVLLFAESLGGVESLITYPWTQTHADIPADIRARVGVTPDLLRLSVGIEDPADLIADLEQALGAPSRLDPAEAVR